MLTVEIDVNSPLGIRYEDNAILNGLAYDGEGKAQACMGVATGDINQDGAIEIVWPSGVRQTYTDLQANSHWIAIENQFLHKLL